ncbi:hypothetical protein SASPL_156829 [Salvia splendens]|uniref:Uncharacterized protein n=1 Tax=Salvia splendens TaxID=180675 RepID=A0A8X8VVY1_SALSN|nr:hypothetical protein SASPL_156829 [Salvia splendens]
MFGNSSGKKAMKWVSLLKDFKEKVGLSPPPPSAPTTPSPPPPRDRISTNANDLSPTTPDFSSLPSSISCVVQKMKPYDVLKCLVQFKVYTGCGSCIIETKMNWNWISRDAGKSSVPPILKRAFVTDIDKLKLSSKTRALEAEKVLLYLSEITKDGIAPGANLLHAVEVLVSGPVDKQSFLDSGIFCCLIHVLNALLAPDGSKKSCLH